MMTVFNNEPSNLTRKQRNARAAIKFEIVCAIVAVLLAIYFPLIYSFEPESALSNASGKVVESGLILRSQGMSNNRPGIRIEVEDEIRTFSAYYKQERILLEYMPGDEVDIRHSGSQVFAISSRGRPGFTYADYANHRIDQYYWMRWASIIVGVGFTVIALYTIIRYRMTGSTGIHETIANLKSE